MLLHHRTIKGGSLRAVVLLGPYSPSRRVSGTALLLLLTPPSRQLLHPYTSNTTQTVSHRHIVQVHHIDYERRGFGEPLLHPIWSLGISYSGFDFQHLYNIFDSGTAAVLLVPRWCAIRYVPYGGDKLAQ